MTSPAFTIAIIEHKEEDSFWRVIAPLLTLKRLLKQKGVSLHIKRIKSGRIGLSDFIGVDVLYLHSPMSQPIAKFLKTCEQFKIRVWIDLDDDTMNVPRHNRFAKNFALRKREIFAMYAMADVISTSTEHLKLLMLNRMEGVYKSSGLERSRMPRFFLRENSFFDFCKPIYTNWKHDMMSFISKDAPAKRVMWRGSWSHHGDLSKQENTQAMLYALEQADMLYIFGMYPGFLDENEKKVTYYPDQGIFDYIHTIQSVRPHVVLNLLADTPFNRAKSDILWQEATVAGAVLMSPAHFPVFASRPCVFYRDVKDFKHKLIQILNGVTGEIADVYEASVQMLKAHNKAAEKQLLDIYETLTGGG